MWLSKLVPMKDHSMLQAYSSLQVSNQKPKFIDRWIENSIQRNV